MRKITLTVCIFALVTLPLTQVAVAEWQENRVTNQTTDNVYVIYSTWRGAKGGIPRGYRTLGYYRISPGQQRSFSAWAGNSIYFRISQSGEAMKPASATGTFAFCIHPSAALSHLGVYAAKTENGIPLCRCKKLDTNWKTTYNS